MAFSSFVVSGVKACTRNFNQVFLKNDITLVAKRFRPVTCNQYNASQRGRDLPCVGKCHVLFTSAFRNANGQNKSYIKTNVKYKTVRKTR